jgi:peptidoglycan hydrolase CwlO-like protein
MKKAAIISGIVLLIIINLAAAVNVSCNDSEQDSCNAFEQDVVSMQFIDPDNETFHELEESKNKLKAEIEVKDLSFFQKLSYLTNNIWVNYIWIKE